MINNYIIENGQWYSYMPNGLHTMFGRSFPHIFSRFQLIDSIFHHSRSCEYIIVITQMFSIFYTHSHFAYLVTWSSKHSKYVFLAIELLTSQTVEILDTAFLYDVDIIFKVHCICNMLGFWHGLCSSHIFMLLTVFKQMFNMY